MFTVSGPFSIWIRLFNVISGQPPLRLAGLTYRRVQMDNQVAYQAWVLNYVYLLGSAGGLSYSSC